MQIELQQTPTRFTASEQRLIRRLRSPLAVQRYLNRLPYNTETRGDTLRSFRQVARKGTAHCLEAALFAACVLEQHGYPPLVMGLESIDGLDHVIFVYKHRGRWGSVARSRDPGLHGRKPVSQHPEVARGGERDVFRYEPALHWARAVTHYARHAYRCAP